MAFKLTVRGYSLAVMPHDKIISKRKRSSSRKRRRTVQKFTFFNEPAIQNNLPKYTQKGIRYPIISRYYDAKRFRISKVMILFCVYRIITFLFRTSHGQLVRFIRPLLAVTTLLNLIIQQKGNIICNVIIKVM